MKRAIKGLLLGVLIYLGFLIYTAPAVLATRYLPPHIIASGITGTVLDGHARHVYVNNVDLGGMHWRLKPLALLLGGLKARVTVEHSALEGQGDIVLKRNALGIEDARFKSEAGILTPLLSSYGAELSGDLDADIQSLIITHEGPVDAEGHLLWRNARLISPSQVGFDDVQIDLAQQGDTATAKLSNTGRAIRLDGQATLSSGWQYNARLRIEPTRDTPQDVRQTLRLVGKTNAKGAVTLDQRGELVALISPLFQASTRISDRRGAEDAQ